MKKISGVTLLLSLNLAYAGSMGPISDRSERHVVIQAGGYWSDQGERQHINIEGLIGDEFTVTQRHASNGLAGLGYYLSGREWNRFQFNYGVNLFYLPKTSVAGGVIQEDLFNNLSYRYDVTHWPLLAMLEAQTPTKFEPLSLLLSVGIGPNFMRTSNFSEKSLDDGITIPDNIFSAHSKTTFSATAGASLQWSNFFGKAALECGYRFFYLGEGRFSRSNSQVIDTLRTGSAYANAVMCAARI